MPITDVSQLDFNRTYTYADYLTWKFEESVELINGRLFKPMAGPGRLHQTVAGNIYFGIRKELIPSPCQVFVAPFDVRLTIGGGNGDQQITTVVQPDIFVVCDRSKLDDRGCLGSPDWIVEIVSPGNTARDTKIKFDLYEESGVGEYWIVYPGLKSVAIYVLDNGQYRLSAEYAEPGPVPAATLPGLTLEWEEIFAE